MLLHVVRLVFFFLCCKVLPCINLSQSIYPCSMDGMKFVSSLAITNNVGMHILLQSFFFSQIYDVARYILTCGCWWLLRNVYVKFQTQLSKVVTLICVLQLQQFLLLGLRYFSVFKRPFLGTNPPFFFLQKRNDISLGSGHYKHAYLGPGVEYCGFWVTVEGSQTRTSGVELVGMGR